MWYDDTNSTVGTNLIATRPIIHSPRIGIYDLIIIIVRISLVVLSYHSGIGYGSLPWPQPTNTCVGVRTRTRGRGWGRGWSLLTLNLRLRFEVEVDVTTRFVAIVNDDTNTIVRIGLITKVSIEQSPRISIDKFEYIQSPWRLTTTLATIFCRDPSLNRNPNLDPNLKHKLVRARVRMRVWVRAVVVVLVQISVQPLY